MYENYAKYFDKIFPANQQTINFLRDNLTGVSILDIGCGSGEMSYALTTIGLNVHGIDLDSNMIDYAKSKYPSIDFNIGNMLHLDTTLYDSIYCIGNTLVHLDTKEDIQSFFNQSNRKLNNHGVLIIQIINYNRIIDSHITTLPTIQNENIVFERTYSEQGDKLRFHTKLSVDDQAYEGDTDLIPLRSNELLEMLAQANFKDIQLYSGFSSKQFDDDAYALVVVAKK